MSEINFNIEPNRIIDQYSEDEVYIGISKNTSSPNSSSWRIKRVWKVGTVYKFGYPNGDQEFKWVWDDRYTYDYE